MGCIAGAGFLILGIFSAAAVAIGDKWHVSDKVSQFWLASALFGIATGFACLCLAFVKWLLGVC